MNIHTEVIAQQLIELIKNNETFKENIKLGIFQNDPNALYSLIEDQLNTYIIAPVQEIIVKELESLVFGDTIFDSDDGPDLDDDYYE
jgi:hypothetical protein